MQKVIVGIGALVLTLIVAAYFVVFHTALPMKLVAKSVAKSGLELEGIGGSIGSGFSFAKVRFKNEVSSLEVDGAAFKYSGLWDLYVKRDLIIEEIRVDRLALKISAQALAGLMQKSNPPSNGQDAKSSQNPTKLKGLNSFIIKSVSITNVSIEAPMTPPIALNRFIVKNLTFAHETMALESLDLDNTWFALNAGKLKYAEKAFSMGQKMTGVVRPALSKKLKREVAFNLNAAVDAAGSNVDLHAMEEKVQVLYGTGKPVVVTLKALTAEDYFDTVLPLKELTLSAETAGVSILGMAPFSVSKGSFKLGEALFTQEDQAPTPQPSFKYGRADAQFTVKMARVPVKEIAMGAPVGAPWIAISESKTVMVQPPAPAPKRRGGKRPPPPAPVAQQVQVTDTREVLADLLFQKAFAATQPQDQAKIQDLASFFGTDVPRAPASSPVSGMLTAPGVARSH